MDRRRWERARLAALDRDDYACTRCGSRIELEVHHVVALEDGGDEYDVGNLSTLCRGCHIDEHGRRDPLYAERRAWARLVAEA